MCPGRARSSGARSGERISEGEVWVGPDLKGPWVLLQALRLSVPGRELSLYDCKRQKDMASSEF